MIDLPNLNFETYGPPDQLASSLSLRAKLVVNGGCWGDAVNTVIADTLTFFPTDPSGNATTFDTDQWKDYDIMLVARANGDFTPVPIANFRVTGNDGNNLSVAPDPVAAGINNGDVFVMLIKPDPALTKNTTVGGIPVGMIGDPNMVNAYSPLGLTPSTTRDQQVRILTGKSKAAVRTVVDNDATSWTVSQPWDAVPDDTSRPITEESGWQDNADTEVISTADPAPIAAPGLGSGLPAGDFPGPGDSGPFQALANADATTGTYPFAGETPAPQCGKLNIQNWSRKVILIQANIYDADEAGSLEPFAPVRMVYVWGNPGRGGLSAPGYYTITPAFGNAIIDLANGLNQRLVLSASAVTLLKPVWTGGTIVAGLSITLYIDQDASGGRATPIFTGGAGGFGSDTGSEQVAPDLNTRTSAIFTYHGTRWIRDSWKTGLSLT